MATEKDSLLGEFDYPEESPRKMFRNAKYTDPNAMLRNTNDDFFSSLSLEQLDDHSDLQGVPEEGPIPSRMSRFSNGWNNLWNPQKVYHSRTIELDQGKANVMTEERDLPKNIVSNTKYTWYNFIFKVLFEQFRFFFNIYFLLVAISQFIPAIQVGYRFTYVSPLVFVLCITIAKEAVDDFHRWRRDVEANSQLYFRHSPQGLLAVPSSELKVGDLIEVEMDQRVPADLLLLRTTERSGSSFIRTDQLDGETDWKLRKAVTMTQKFPDDASLLNMCASAYVEPPHKEIYQFVGVWSRVDHSVSGTNTVWNEPLTLENTVWANTVMASGNIVGLVIYTGQETKARMNTNQPKNKVGKLDLELNSVTKYLFVFLCLMALTLVAFDRFRGRWMIMLMRYVLLFSSIVPISLRVNLDMSKIMYSLSMMRDPMIEGTIVRNSTIPEELGRISYLLTDKTGTLTQNEMIFKKLHLGTIIYGQDTLDTLSEELLVAYNGGKELTSGGGVFSESMRRQDVSRKVLSAITALALCHNVTPTYDDLGALVYQASSPDEVALVRLTERVGMTVVTRDVHSISIRTPVGQVEEYDVLHLFPFTSESKRMGIVVRHRKTGVITFYMKGADVVMNRIVAPSDWLDEECDNMARDGLRTLVFGSRVLVPSEYEAWQLSYVEARSSIQDREIQVQASVALLEHDLKLLGMTGVEDKLQVDVKSTLEQMRYAGIRTWMLTGDKIETATCIATSARLVSRNQSIHPLVVKSKREAYESLQRLDQKKDAVLAIDGFSLQLCIDHYRDLFMRVACKAPSVVCCRCSPTQKAEVVQLVRRYTGLRTCAIGDGGNDVSMIQAAHVGLGIEGKEGRQASLAADFSIPQFSYIAPMLLWHGRNSYKRSARLSQFIIHRGLVISFIQAIFSALFYFSSVSIFTGWLLVFYPILFTMAPVLSLVLDEDLSKNTALEYPELYHDLQKGRSLNAKTFMIWVFISIYQGGMIMLLSVLLFDSTFYSIVSITYTTLILVQLLNIAFEINRWHWMMIVAEIVSLLSYIACLFILKGYFDLSVVLRFDFLWKTLLITMVATLPVYLVRFIKRRCDPPTYSKVL